MPKLVFLFVFLTTIVQALTLSDAINHAWQHSTLLQEQQYQWEMSANDRWRRFIPNEPQLQLSQTDDNVAQTIGISETLSLPFKTLAMTKIDSAKEKTQKAEYESKKYEITKNVTQTFVDCALAHASAKQQQKSISDNETLSRSLHGRYESGVASQAEHIGIDLQLRQQQADLLASLDRVEVLCTKLHKLLALDTKEVEYVLPDDLPPEVFQGLAQLTGDENRAKALIFTANANETLSWWGQLPDVTLGVAKNHYVYLPGSPSGKENTYSFTLSVTIPILFPFRETVEARRNKSQAIIDRNTADLQLLNATSDKADAGREYRRSKERLKELHTKDLALAQVLMDSTFSAYRTGKLGFAELVLAKKTLADLQNQEIQLRGSVISAHLRCLSDCEGNPK